MQHASSRRSRSRGLRGAACAATFLGSLLAFAACKSTDGGSAANAPAKVELSNEVTATAQVLAVDKAARSLTLQREDGAMVRIRVPAEVRNYDQIAPGHQLRVRYQQKLSVERNTATGSAADAQLALAAARAPKGAMPAAAAGVGMQVVVTIESIDAQRDIVVFTTPSGELISHRVASAEGRAFVRGLKIGDKVTLGYSEALALSVEAL